MGFHYGDGFYEDLRLSVGDNCNQFGNLLIQAASRLGLALRHSRIARPGPTYRFPFRRTLSLHPVGVQWLVLAYSEVK